MAAARRGKSRNSRKREEVPFPRRLVLHQWVLGLFGVERFDDLARHMREEALEGLDEDGIHRLHRALCLHVPPEQRPELPDERLRRYDEAIVSVTRELNDRRVTHGEPPIVWKYFQYLALLFTEIYLERYFADPKALLASINERITAFSAAVDERDGIAPLDGDTDDPSARLNKLAFWMATGSGKTLLMHAHILQYRRHLEASGRERGLNRILLLTPNEGLSRQHLREFEKSGIAAEIFEKDTRGLFAGKAVEILEVTKLKEEMGPTTVAVEAFEGNNLVLVDEGHRGASAGQEGAWMKHRNALCERGFSFEYSATFGQAVKGSAALAQSYARNILCDYSYRWFYDDGFGKDYHILNLDDDRDAEWMATYLTACLLSFYQQQRFYREQEVALRPFGIERPLWIFVGGSVTATLASRDASDIVAILKFLAAYASDRTASTRRIERVLSGGIVTASGKDLFAGRFAYLNMSKLTADQLFEDTLATLFNAPAGGALHVENLAGAPGEIALRLGDNEPFGVVNVGDDGKLVKLCEESGLAVAEREFAGSLFHELERADSNVHVLIGSRKFTEGWSSWRVSTMGLMNIGRGEGAQIIQLFGRGVRLKGYALSLKRSSRAALPDGLTRPKHIGVLETLSIFGVRADYMAQFREFLRLEGMPDDDGRIELVLPIVKGLGGRPLKTIRLKEQVGGAHTTFGDAFRRLGAIPTLGPPNPEQHSAATWLQQHPVELNWYPRIEGMRSEGAAGEEADRTMTLRTLGPSHIALLDIDRLCFDLERYKAERRWHNLNITRRGVRALLADTTWYRLFIPESELRPDSLEKANRWQEIALALLCKYTERFHKFCKREWELPHLEYRELSDDDPNFPTVGEDPPEYGYRIRVDESQKDIVAKLLELRASIEAGKLAPWEFRGLTAVWCGPHLYQPLLHLDGNAVEVSPVALNDGERAFVEDLRAFCGTKPELLDGVELFLLRNLSKGRGVGFFEAGNFHPDFILWLVRGDRQHIAFVDPKGLRQVGIEDPKVNFFETIKEIEQRLGDANVSLDSFLISNTPSHEMTKQWGVEKEEMLAMHILFQREDKSEYVAQLIGAAIRTAG